jgi:tRNA pseudouridine32 synthase / 23S rRNA pseudouridine746 synthase
MMEFTYDPPDVPLRILHQDDHILVVDKPAGLLSVPGKMEGRGDCLIARIADVIPQVLLVHRLDCDTSGVMIFALNKLAQGHLGKQFEGRIAQKTYVARVAGVMAADSGHVDLPLCADWPNRPRQMVDHVNGRSAQTDWVVIGRSADETRVRMAPRTGRSHQLRVHMMTLGHAILGDPIYGTVAANRMMLHAESLTIRHPVGGEFVTFDAVVPF